MPTLDELEQLNKRGEAIAQVVAEKLGLDPSQIISGTLTVEVDPAGETVRWNGLSKRPTGFLSECIEEAKRRES